MRLLFFLCLTCFSFSTWSCFKPTSQELIRFFEDSAKWTEVKNKESRMIETKRPVYLNIGFDKKSKTSIRWGDNEIGGKDISICWYSPDKKRIRIVKGFFRVTLIKVRKGLLKSWIPMDGDLFYRKDKEVIRPQSSRRLAKDPAD